MHKFEIWAFCNFILALLHALIYKTIICFNFINVLKGFYLYHQIIIPPFLTAFFLFVVVLVAVLVLLLFTSSSSSSFFLISSLFLSLVRNLTICSLIICFLKVCEYLLFFFLLHYLQYCFCFNLVVFFFSFIKWSFNLFSVLLISNFTP